MRLLTIILTMLMASVGQSALASGATSAFERLKGMAGAWEVILPSGEKSSITFEVISDGSALLERHGGMVSVYHLDHESILMTHYCAAKNQPRLRVTDFSSDPATLDFNFVDVTNLEPGSSHINHLTFRFISNDEVEESWSYVDGKGNTGTEVFKIRRTNL